ncbi:MAG TPA: asparagine synthase (glutamine-hydrolyzing) [Solirubrobacteraceae bacterium]|nr:asparagine synthase (glutamine-hydrolyzing) [Solirubrobacteraceae bacterium]
MCGIAATYGTHPSGEAERMLGRLSHRGPDDAGRVELDGAWLGHRRLSIVDVDGGHQPFANAAGDVWLVGNGEVYNHEQVRATLAPAPFVTRSDNEVALHLLDERGPQALGELEGMFAFLAAGDDGRFVAARDAVGIKPLYWARRDGDVRFASEIAAFAPEWMPDVEAFPPGCHWTPDGGLARFASAVPQDGDGAPAARAVWSADAEPPEAALAATRRILVESVGRQMMGDVPVGVFLSGGLDSAIVAAIAAAHCERRGERLRTFAVGTGDSADLLAARVVARHLDCEHHERVYDAREAIRALPDVVRSIEHFDPSLVRSAVPNYLLAEMTAQHVKVVLTGEGADELFAGYAYLRGFDGADALQAELMRTVHGLHNLNLQRCDRVTMAHGLEARVPFLDRQVIAFAFGLPMAWKLSAPGELEKRLLRRAFAGWLPDEILWREKAEFGDGSGAKAVLTNAIEEGVTRADLARERDAVDPPLRTREELAYHRIFAEHLPGVRPERTLGRFATA